MTDNAGGHYDEKYFQWQQSIGEFGGWAELSKFKPYISETDEVLDFGCGGGYLLGNIHCRRKIGIEINPEAARIAKKNGVEVYLDLQDIPEEYVDVIISNNALEHTLNPFLELKNLYSRLRVGGKIICYIPCESISLSYQPNDMNQHLYSWSPKSAGNLFTKAGFAVIESKAYIHKWPPKYRFIAKFGGRGLFEIACRFYGRIQRSWFQVRVVAKKTNPF